MPGSGKSTIGKEVARRLDLPFLDCDKAIERRAGRSVAELFESGGEGAFRDLESEILVSLIEEGASVIATGGGVLMRPGNRELLRTRTVCVFLDASHDLLWRRLRHDRRRPLLQVADPEARLRGLREERDLSYRETAHIVIPIDGVPFDRLVDEVLRRVTAAKAP